jgi:UTP--glucose-1-phosphate uridylyltransferase
MFGMKPGIQQLLDVANAENMAVVGVIEVPENKVDRYGIIEGEEYRPGVFRVRRLVEKPPVGRAPSRMAIVGRYVLTPDIFGFLEKLTPGVGGELQLTDALQGLADKNRLLAVKLRGQRFDAGDWVEYLTANIYFALHDEDLHDDLVRRIHELVPCKGK